MINDVGSQSNSEATDDMSTPVQSQRAYCQKLQFVSGQDKASRKIARSHIVREIQRRKRIENSSKRCRPPSDAVGSIANDRLEASGREQGTDEGSKSIVQLHSEHHHEHRHEHPILDDSVKLCVSLLGPGNQDLFAVFPVHKYAQSYLLSADCKSTYSI